MDRVTLVANLRAQLLSARASAEAARTASEAALLLLEAMYPMPTQEQSGQPESEADDSHTNYFGS